MIAFFLLIGILYYGEFGVEAQTEPLLENFRQFLQADSTTEGASLEKILASSPTYEQIQKWIAQVSVSSTVVAPGSYRYTFPVSWANPPYEAEYYVLVPQDYDPQKTYPLVLEVHGTYGSGEKLAQDRMPLLQISKTPTFFVLPSSKESAVGWRFTEEERRIQLTALFQVIRQFPIDWNRIYLTGGSRGGHATWELGLFYTDYFAAAYPVCGGPRAKSLRYLENLKNLPLKDVQGALDDPLLVENLRYADQKLQQLKAPWIYHEEPDQGHAVVWSYLDTLSFFVEKQRNPHPKEVFCSLEEIEHGERFWIRVLQLDPKIKTPKQISVPHFQKMNETERRRSYIQALEKYRAWIRGTIEENNSLQLQYQGVQEIEIRWDPILLNPEKSVTIRANKKELWKGSLSWNPRFCLKEYKRFRDSHRLYWGNLKLKLPNK